MVMMVVIGFLLFFEIRKAEFRHLSFLELEYAVYIYLRMAIWLLAALLLCLQVVIFLHDPKASSEIAESFRHMAMVLRHKNDAWDHEPSFITCSHL